MAETITFTVNGQSKSVITELERPLLDVLREDLQFSGAKFGCGEGRCGACSVLIDGKRAFSCRTPASAVQGKTLLTIEGLAPGGEKLHPVQEAFLEEGAFQCGYCTAGMILCAVQLLNTTPKPTDGQIVTAMDKNICRCCSYPRIFKAVQRAAGRPTP